jgi:hypothetical protein
MCFNTCTEPNSTVRHRFDFYTTIIVLPPFRRFSTGGSYYFRSLSFLSNVMWYCKSYLTLNPHWTRKHPHHHGIYSNTNLHKAWAKAAFHLQGKYVCTCEYKYVCVEEIRTTFYLHHRYYYIHFKKELLITDEFCFLSLSSILKRDGFSCRQFNETCQGWKMANLPNTFLPLRLWTFMHACGAYAFIIFV